MVASRSATHPARPALGGRRWAALACLAAAAGGCAEEAVDDPRSEQLASVLVAADQPFAAGRPELAAGKWRRMATGLYDYHRGTVPVYSADFRANRLGIAASAYADQAPLVPSLGDPHPENFGLLLSDDGALALEPNDADSMDRLPYLWDVRRLLVGMLVASAASNGNVDGRVYGPLPPDEACPPASGTSAEAQWLRLNASGCRRRVAAATARGYADEVLRRAAGGEPRAVVAPSGSAVIDDRFESAEGDAGDELTELTELADGRRRLVRGVVGECDEQHADLSGAWLDALQEALLAYGATLLAPPDAAELTLLDAVRVYGKGVSSYPRVRLLALVRGPSDDPSDDRILELRELADSGAAGYEPPGVSFDTVQARAVVAARRAWARPDADPRWGATEWLGFPMVVRTESEAHKGLGSERLAGELGTVEALEELGAVLGALLGRIHAAPDREGASAAARVAECFAADIDGFVAEQVEVALRYAEETLADHERFRALVVARGPLLGYTPRSDERPPSELARLFVAPIPCEESP